MRIQEFDYALPTSLIAQYPSPQRDESRLMVLHRQTGAIEHRTFRDVSDYLLPGDLLVMNNTRVISARLIGKKETGGKIEILLIPLWNGTEGEWEVLIKGSAKVRPGARIQFEQGFYGALKEVKNGRGKVSFFGNGEVMDILSKIGRIPLPPYIKRKDEPLDRERYQTVVAERDGAIAAPTAGLHFTQSLLQSLRNRGVGITFITLHVGIGTFAPVKVTNVEDHRMDTEWAEIPEEVAGEIDQTRVRGRKIIAVGTTTTRTLESFSNGDTGIRSGRQRTSLFIYPPYHFRVIDGLITNFHLPRSTLIMLVAAFAGKDLLMKAYREAIDKKYRFYSYGDAMLIL